MPLLEGIASRPSPTFRLVFMIACERLPCWCPPCCCLFTQPSALPGSNIPSACRSVLGRLLWVRGCCETQVCVACQERENICKQQVRFGGPAIIRAPVSSFFSYFFEEAIYTFFPANKRRDTYVHNIQRLPKLPSLVEQACFSQGRDITVHCSGNRGSTGSAADAMDSLLVDPDSSLHRWEMDSNVFIQQY